MRLMEHALGRASQDSLHQQREYEGRTFLLMSCTIGGRFRSEARVSYPTVFWHNLFSFSTIAGDGVMTFFRTIFPANAWEG
jgi:hypothetical protein